MAYVPPRLFEDGRRRTRCSGSSRSCCAEGVSSQRPGEARRGPCFKELIDRVADEAFDSPEPDSTARAELADVYTLAPVARHAGCSRQLAANADGRREAKGRADLRYIDAISDGLRERDASLEQRVVLIGQDIAEYGGAFKVTEGFARRVRRRARAQHAHHRVRRPRARRWDWRIEGFRPMVEMQFGDFISCGFNQVVNNLAKTHYRWGAGLPVVDSRAGRRWHGRRSVPLAEPGGLVHARGGPEGGGAGHTRDAKGLLLAAFQDGNPVLYLEHKFLYRSTKGAVPEGCYTEPIGPARWLATALT